MAGEELLLGFGGPHKGSAGFEDAGEVVVAGVAADHVLRHAPAHAGQPQRGLLNGDEVRPVRRSETQIACSTAARTFTIAATLAPAGAQARSTISTGQG